MKFFKFKFLKNIFAKYTENIDDRRYSVVKIFGIKFKHRIHYTIYNKDTLRDFCKNKKPHILMCVYSICSGGGETLPIFISNELQKRGYPIIILSWMSNLESVEIRKLIDKKIPIITMYNHKFLPKIVKKYAIDIIQSQHGVIDEYISKHRKKLPERCKHLVVTHGYYETRDKKTLKKIMPKLLSKVDRWLYTTDKNLDPFKPYIKNFQNFYRVYNALPVVQVNPVERKDLDIPQEAFVLCMIARGVYDKGWLEAIEAVKIARQNSDKNIHLIMIGDGELYEKLKNNVPNFIHLLGVRSNIRDYISASDMLIVPSKFKGESFPLVIIDSLMCCKPVIASDIGEIRKMLTDNQGNIAGKIFELDGFKIPVNNLAKIIEEFATTPKIYNEAQVSAAKMQNKYDIQKVIDIYIKHYEELVKSEP